MPLQRLQNLSEIAPATWDALVPESQPFLRHAFLSALEDSGSVGPHTGWQPEYLLHIEAGRLIAALPRMMHLSRQLWPRQKAFGRSGRVVGVTSASTRVATSRGVTRTAPALV